VNNRAELLVKTLNSHEDGSVEDGLQALKTEGPEFRVVTAASSVGQAFQPNKLLMGPRQSDCVDPQGAGSLKTHRLQEIISRRGRRTDRHSAAAYHRAILGRRCGSSFRRQRYLRLLWLRADPGECLDSRRRKRWLGQFRLQRILRIDNFGGELGTG
jgi:hypothetical protein